MIKIKSANSLNKLDRAGFLAFVSSCVTLCGEYGLNDEAAHLSSLEAEAKRAYTASKRNQYVQQQREVHTRLRREVAIVCAVLRNSSEVVNQRAYEAYCRLVKGRFHSGMYVFVGSLSYFVQTKEVAALVGYEAEKIAKLKELISLYNSLDSNKIKAKGERKRSKKGGDFRREIQQYVELIRAKLVMRAFETGDEGGVVEFNELIVSSRHYRVRNAKSEIRNSESEIENTGLEMRNTGLEMRNEKSEVRNEGLVSDDEVPTNRDGDVGVGDGDLSHS